MNNTETALRILSKNVFPKSSVSLTHVSRVREPFIFTIKPNEDYLPAQITLKTGYRHNGLREINTVDIIIDDVVVKTSTLSLFATSEAYELILLANVCAFGHTITAV